MRSKSSLSMAHNNRVFIKRHPLLGLGAGPARQRQPRCPSSIIAHTPRSLLAPHHVFLPPSPHQTAVLFRSVEVKAKAAKAHFARSCPSTLSSSPCSPLTRLRLIHVNKSSFSRSLSSQKS